MYQALKKSKIKAEYEPETFVLQDGFMCEIQCYERQSNGKGDMVNRGEKKILPIKYTPDFIGNGFIIETKGRANESFPMRWKMFKKYINKHNMPARGNAKRDIKNIIRKKQNNIKCSYHFFYLPNFFYCPYKVFQRDVFHH